MSIILKIYSLRPIEDFIQRFPLRGSTMDSASLGVATCFIIVNVIPVVPK